MTLHCNAAVLVVYVLISAVIPTAEAGFWSKELQQPAFAIVPPSLSTEGRGALTELQQLATKETFINKLLGTDCFTKCLNVVNKDCNKLESEKKSRLAMALAICHLDQLGLPTFACKPSMSLKQCADTMHSDRQYTTYMEFLSNIDTMCLFLQSQDFQRHTEFMINTLYSSSQHATEQLSAVDTHLSQSLRTMDNMEGKLSNVETAQEQQLQLSHENLKGVQQLHVHSQQVHAQLEHALRNEEVMLVKQSQVLTNLASLDEEEAARAESAALRWQEAQEQAVQLLQQQHQYQQVQQQLLGDLRQLSDNSAGLRSALDVVVQYEQQGAAMLTHMLGSTYTVQDLMAYALAALGIAATGLSKGLRAARLTLIGLLALSVVGERAVVHSFHHLLEVDPTGQIMMAMPLFGATINPRTVIRRVCLATAVAIIMWGFWKHTDSEQETLRSCRRMEQQQMLHYQQQQKSTEELLQAMKQQYIEFMTKGLQQLNNVSEPDPVSPSQTHIRCANGQRQEQLPWTDNEAQEQLQQHPQQPEEQLCLSRPQLCEDRPPAVQTPSILSRNHGGRADRKQESRTGVQHDSTPCLNEAPDAAQDDTAMSDMHQQQPKQDQRLKQHGLDVPCKAQARTFASQLQVEQQDTAAQQKRKKRSASEADQIKEAADIKQTEAEAISDARCKASKRQRPAIRAMPDL